MPRTVRFYFDYVDPLARAAEAVAVALEAQGLEVQRLPLELRPPPAPLLLPTDEGLLARYQQALTHGPREVDAPPRLIPWTRKAHELALHAREKGAFPRVHTALLSAHLSRGLDIGRVDVLVELGADAGLDRSETKAVLDVDRHAEAVDQIRAQALSEGIRTVPCFVIGERHYEGVPAAETLEHAATEE